jgi:hypothetical protein
VLQLHLVWRQMKLLLIVVLDALRAMLMMMTVLVCSHVVWGQDVDYLYKTHDKKELCKL